MTAPGQFLLALDKNLRHFNATQLLAAGVDLRTTAGRLGHGDGGATTLRVYASWTAPVDRRAADQLAHDLMRLRQGASGGKSELGLSAIPSSRPLARPVAEVLLPRTASSYVDVIDAVEQAVVDGRLTAGDLLPTVTQLAEFFRVARSTAQRAVTALAASGVLLKVAGRWRVAPKVMATER